MKTGLSIKGNILVYYTAAMLFMVISASWVTGYLISLHQERHVLMAHTEFYPELIKAIIADKPDLTRGVYSPASYLTDRNKLQAFISDILAIKGIHEVSIVDVNGKILLASNPNLQSADLLQNIDFQKILTEQISYDFSNKKANLLRIYIPLKDLDQIHGVVILTESSSHLASVIDQSRATVWLVISAGGLILYLLLFFIFFHSYKTQSRINRHLRETQDVTIFSLGYQAELRDLETGKHIERTSAYVEILANGLLKNEKYKSYMTGDYINDLIRSAPLHDIGKVAIPDSILLKPEKLSEDEFRLMQSHTGHGSDILEKAEHKLSFPSFFKIAIQMCRHHHEKWDGTGYPGGLKGDDIPLSARIMALADVYDALRSSRPYKDEFSHEKSVSIINKEKGVSFDPDIVDVFLVHEKTFENISIRMKDDFPDQVKKVKQVHPEDEPV